MILLDPMIGLGLVLNESLFDLAFADLQVGDRAYFKVVHSLRISYLFKGTKTFFTRTILWKNIKELVFL
jgi:hypothetical protein